MSTVAIVVAAGGGQRLGRTEPKAFAPLAGRPLFLHCVTVLAPLVDRLVVVVPDGWEERARAALRTVDEHAQVVAGGARRADSVACGLAAAGECDRVAVHDAARPLLSAALYRRCAAALDDADACAPGLPLTDTIKRVHGGSPPTVVQTVPRAGLWAVQTPQLFRAATLHAAHEQAGEQAGGHDVTDDLVLVERAGGRVVLVPGERRNHKVTYAEDLAFVAALLAMPDVCATPQP